jgi:hypothetical protein
MECAYYMMLNLLQYLKVRWKGPNIIIDGGKWFTPKYGKEPWGVVYKIIKDAVTTEWRKEFLNKDETMYERPLSRYKSSWHVNIVHLKIIIMRFSYVLCLFFCHL